MYSPVASWCVVVGGEEGVVYVAHEGHVRGGGWLRFVGAGDVSRDVVPEVAHGGHPVDPCLPLPRLGVAGGHVGLMVAGVALDVRPPRHGNPDLASRGGRALP